MEQSIIYWEKGKPTRAGRYLVQTVNDGLQISFWSTFIKTWSLYSESEIIAWCHIDDIELYKEE